MSATAMSPDERTFREHLARGRFRAGVAARRWRLIDVAWPFALIAVTAAQRPGGPTEFVIRFELTSYPHTAPTGGLWDVESDGSLPADRRPKGERAARLFRTDGWAGGATAMYAPWDRVGLRAHPGWAQKHPLEAWNPSREISFILSRVHEVLNADDYLGV
jgi:hypothetical protein